MAEVGGHEQAWRVDTIRSIQVVTIDANLFPREVTKEWDWSSAGRGEGGCDSPRGDWSTCFVNGLNARGENERLTLTCPLSEKRASTSLSIAILACVIEWKNEKTESVRNQ